MENKVAEGRKILESMAAYLEVDVVALEARLIDLANKKEGWK